MQRTLHARDAEQTAREDRDHEAHATLTRRERSDTRNDPAGERSDRVGSSAPLTDQDPDDQRGERRDRARDAHPVRR